MPPPRGAGPAPGCWLRAPTGRDSIALGVDPRPAPTPPGRGTTPPGRGPTPPGRGTTPPGRGTPPPGRGTTPPGRGTTPPDGKPGPVRTAARRIAPSVTTSDPGAGSAGGSSCAAGRGP